MSRHIGIVIVLGISTLAACDTLAPLDSGKRARPSLQAGTSQGQRPAVVESALTSACDPNAYSCITSDELEYCGRSGLASQSCTSICRSAGFAASNGCGFEPSLGGDACFCDSATSSSAPSCAPGWSCAGDALTYCQGGTLESWDCNSVCRDAGYDFAVACDWDDASGDESCFCDDHAGAAGCAADDQACGDGTCVAASYICDGYDDCPSGADEFGCSQCGFSGGLCNGSNHLDVCDLDGTLATYDCDEVCQQSGYDLSEGCDFDSYGGSDACFCGDLPSCAPGDLVCGDGSCLAGQYVCDGYADCSGFDDEFGCATECQPGEVYCTGDFTLETCNDNGLWVDWDCDAVCQGAGYRAAQSCGYDSFSGGDSCFCAN